MSLFGRKKRPPSAADVPLPEEADRRWQGACRANPQVYQPRDSGALLGVLTLTESVDTLLPLHPEHLWTAHGQPVSRWILCLVSLREDRVLGQMEYPESMRRLCPHVLAESGGRLLVRAMTHDQLDGLFAGLPRNVI